MSAVAWVTFGFAVGLLGGWLTGKQARADLYSDLARVRRQRNSLRTDNLALMQRLNRAEFTVEAIDDARRRQSMAAHPAGGCDEAEAELQQIIEDAL